MVVVHHLENSRSQRVLGLLEDFLQRMHARPAYQRALAKGGPYELMR